MIKKLGQVMVYVKNQDEAVKFWTENAGFTVISEEENGQGMRWIEIAPSSEAETSIILHDKELISKMQPDLNLGTPSLMFFTDNLDQLHSRLLNKEVTVGEIVEMPSGRVFNFADSEKNYFAVMEKSE
ncbi:VOC family protein [Metabacillus idriensis]|uniref:VOC family protein n=1 Tax=Metabacillus idriensis TaxID=324768 RepID=A0A6I2MKI4_9BACI|nr:VOC family protein [Metabacillus idriensis]MCM3597867.1 VOC family protein [Metabacillus idriensis]MRX56353.1 VOC family protein [Metabacillus idriensis]